MSLTEEERRRELIARLEIDNRVQSIEIRQLREKLESLNKDLFHKQQEMRDQTYKMQRMGKDVGRMNSALAGLQGQLDSTQQQLDRAHYQLEQSEKTQAELRRQIQEEQRRRKEELQALRSQREADRQLSEREIQRINERIDQLAQEQRNRQEGDLTQAEYWVEQAQRARAELSKELHPEKFEPMEWQRLTVDLETAEADLREGRYANAISAGMNAFRWSEQLREILIAEEIEWNRSLLEARSRELELAEALESAKNRAYEFEVDGRKVRDENGVDYWTYGNLSVLEERIRNAREKLDEEPEAMSQQELDECVEALAGLMDELRLLENAAEVNLDMAQRRAEMARKIGKALGDRFLMRDADGDYVGREPRDAYHAVFENATTGDFVTVVDTPMMGPNGVVINHLEMVSGVPSNVKENSEKFRKAVVEDLSQQVEGFQLDCTGQYGKNGPQEADRMADMDAVAQGSAAVRSQAPSMRPKQREGYVSVQEAVQAATQAAQRERKKRSAAQN